MQISPLVMIARNFAIKHHKNSYGDKPYVFHLDQVAKKAEEFGEESVILAYLHDTVEDCETVNYDLIEKKFGKKMAKMLDYLSDGEGKNRKQRKADMHMKMASLKDEELYKAIIVKVCDRYANVTHSKDGNNKSMYKMYKKEHPAFRISLYRAGLCDDLWLKLDKILSYDHKKDDKMEILSVIAKNGDKPVNDVLDLYEDWTGITKRKQVTRLDLINKIAIGAGISTYKAEIAYDSFKLAISPTEDIVSDNKVIKDDPIYRGFQRINKKIKFR